MKPMKKIAGGAGLIATMLVSLAVAQPAAASTPYCQSEKIITTADSGRTIGLRAGDCATLKLDPGLDWSTPTSSNPKAVSVYDIPTFVADQTWGLQAGRRGRSTISSTGSPHCPPGKVCPLYVRLFTVNIRVLPWFHPNAGV